MAHPTRDASPPAHSDPAQGVRLNKALSQAGICSRRRADELILTGKVLVNGVLIHEPGVKIDPNRDTVVVNGQKAAFSPQKTHIYLVFHKPVQTVTTASDPQGRPTVFDLLPPEIPRQGLFTVGRLDFYSEGLLLFTDDGELTHRLTHPSTHVPKIYHVLVRGQVNGRTLSTMAQGMRLAEGEVLAPVEATVLHRESPERALLSLRLIQGVNRQIRRMCRDLGLTVLRLTRVAQGPILLGDLPRGTFRPLAPEEVSALRAAAGLGPVPHASAPPACAAPARDDRRRQTPPHAT
ncbi:rRNA pseudouridine synthase, partial [Desulfovibrio sulfodismutans]|nr:rRNA pseudouridine synthase [Desulfolutivibrio sulfodismutans]